MNYELSERNDRVGRAIKQTTKQTTEQTANEAANEQARSWNHLYMGVSMCEWLCVRVCLHADVCVCGDIREPHTRLQFVVVGLATVGCDNKIDIPRSSNSGCGGADEGNGAIHRTAPILQVL